MTTHSDVTHLTREFGRYFPDAIIGITYNDEAETITVNLILPDEKTHWVCEIGSDDERYIFTREPGRDWDRPDMNHLLDILTIPLMETQS